VEPAHEPVGDGRQGLIKALTENSERPASPPGVLLFRLLSGPLPVHSEVMSHRSLLAIAICAIVLWAASCALGGWLVYEQYRRGTGSAFLIEISVLPYCVGLTLAFAGLLIARRHPRTSLVVSVIMLALGLLAALLWIMGIGGS
jgi:hypothetical protein